jgi:DNA polymerase I
VQDEESFEKFLNNLKWEQIYFDTETTGLDIKTLKLVGMSFYDGGDFSYYIPVGHRVGKQIPICLVLEKVFQKIKNETKTIVAHNIKYDAKVMMKYWDYAGYEDKKWWDTMIASHLLDENKKSHALKNLIPIFFGGTTVKFDEFLTKYSDASYVPIEEMVDYACNDVEYCHKLYVLFKQKLEEEELLEYFEKFEMPFVRIIIGIEMKGVRINTNLLNHYISTVGKRIVELEELIQKSFPKQEAQQKLFGGVIYDTNIDSSKQLQKILFEDMKFPILQTTENSGQPSCDMEHFELLYEKTKHPIFQLLVENKKLKKLQTSFLESYKEKVQEDGCIYPEILQTRVCTGRLSYINPNTQQLPNLNQYKVYGEDIEVRKLFIADEGYKFIVKDYAAQELKLAAHISNETSMIQAFAEGLDVHLMVAKKSFKLDIPDEVLKETHPQHKACREQYKKERLHAKTVSFGNLYGSGPDNMGQMLGISKEEAQDLINSFFHAFPNLKKSIDLTYRQIDNQGYVRNLFGRKRRFTPIPSVGYSFRDKRQGWNYKIQSSGASILKIVCNKMYREFKRRGCEAHISLTIHDEIVVSCQKDKVEEYSVLMKDIMENTVQLRLPLTTGGNVGDCYADAK